MEAPGSGGINSKGPTSVRRVPTRSWTHIEDAYFEHITRLRILDIYRPGKKVYP
jgi:hypothetical protein